MGNVFGLAVYGSTTPSWSMTHIKERLKSEPYMHRSDLMIISNIANYLLCIVDAHYSGSKCINFVTKKEENLHGSAFSLLNGAFEYETRLSSIYSIIYPS